MKKLIQIMGMAIALLATPLPALSQVEPGAFGYYRDALRHAQTTPFGTARLQGLGGAGSVLGGNLGAGLLNPAGLGMYNRSQLIISPSLNLQQNTNDFLGQSSRNEETGLELGSLGVAIHFGKGGLNAGGWKGGTLAITYNRINNFNQRITYGAQNNNASIIDAMLNRADLFFPDELGGIERVGYDHFLINPVPGAEDLYVSFVEGFPFQQENITRSGRTDQVNIAFGGNFDDKLYLGGGIGITNTDFFLSRIYTESFAGSALNQFSLDEQLDVSGTGINVNLGVIFRPINAIRIGASYTSPTWHSFSEESDAIYSTDYNNYDVANFLDDDGNRLITEDTVLNFQQSETPIFFSDYNLRTPSKFNIGAAFFIGKNGFITVDVEHLNYTNSFVSSVDFNPNADNQTIDNIYQSATNIRLGGEFRYNIFRLRAGYASIGDAFKDEFDGIDRSRVTYSGGLGANLGKYFLDFAYTQTSFDESFTSFTFLDGTGPTASINNTIGKASLTLGLNF